MAPPVIGVCAHSERADQGAWKDDPVDIVRSALVAELQDAGLIVSLIPYDSSLTENPDEVLRLLDGVVLQPEAGDGTTDDSHRRFEQALADRAGELGIPVARPGDAGAITEFAAEVAARTTAP
jgi:gamma-glutamyl-gamma-aminobutyrate hydrolase PuuD